MTPIIYALSDPRDGRMRYVGYTKNFATRMSYHYRDPKYNAKGSSPCLTRPWLLELAELGMLATGRILERLTNSSDWQERERFWIAYFKAQGEPLLNGTEGGYGSRGRRWTLSSERCQQISIRNKQAWLNRSEEERKAALDVLAEGRRQRHPELDGPHTEDHRQKIGEKSKEHWGKWRAEQGFTGTWDERRKKPGGHKEAWDRMTPEKKANTLAALNTGRHLKGRKHPWSEAAKEKVSMASSKYWANKPTEEKMDLVQPMLIARKNSWSVLTPEERRERMAKVWAGRKKFTRKA